MLEAAVDAEIDYVDKKGNSSRRLITTEEIYDYEDGEIVIRAFCHKRTAMRTFVASRIEYWLDVDSKKPVEVSDSKGFLKYLKRKANFDAVNVAGRVLSSTGPCSTVFVHQVGKFTGNKRTTRTGSVKYKIGVKMAGRLTDYVMDLAMENPFLKAELESISTLQLAEVRAEVCNELRTKETSDSIYLLMAGIFKDEPLASRRAFVQFTHDALNGMPEQDSVVQVLKDELLDPSFKIQPFTAALKASQHANELKQQKERKKRTAAERKAIQKAALEGLRTLARETCVNQLLSKKEEGVMVFERVPFENECRRLICAEVGEERMEDCGDLFLPRIGNGIQFGYLMFGLKKKNRGWYPNDEGKVVIDLNNVEG